MAADDKVTVNRSALEAAMELIASGAEHDRAVREAGIRDGREAAVHGYDTGYALGHDTGLSARQDTRSFVHGVLQGFEAGSQERQRLARDLLERQRDRDRERRDHDLEAAG